MFKDFRFSWSVSTSALAVALTCYYMSSWQFHRYQEKKIFFADIKNPGTAEEFRPEQAPAIGSKIKLSGAYDFNNEFYLLNRAYHGIPGLKIITPLILPGESRTQKPVVVLVDRGWIPYMDLQQKKEANYQTLAASQMPLIAFVRQSKEARSLLSPPEFQQPSQHGARVLNWFRMNVKAIAQQLPDYSVLPYYLEAIYPEDMAGKTAGRPVSLGGEVLPPGRHLNYTLQWISFGSFALLIGILWQFRKR